MIDLFLAEPIFNDEKDDDSAKLSISLLSKLESILWKLLTSGGRSELRLWLSNTIAGMTSISPQHKRDLFVTFLRLKPLKWGLASQLLLMLFEKRSREVGSLIAKRSNIMNNFFKGNPRCISQWFSNFTTSGPSEHGRGAKALAQFAFVNRDICWEELEWKGKHGQSPAVVATKPHYFLDLDVEQTVKNFIKNVPEFWSSDEFAESLKDGEIFFIDTNFFVRYFADLMFEDDSKDVWEVINNFLMVESFSSLCQRLLITLEEADFSSFLKMLCKFLSPEIKSKDFGRSSSFLFEVILSKFGGCESIDQILLLNAVINQGRQILRLRHDEDAEEEWNEINSIVSQISAISSNTRSLSPLLKECCNRKTMEMIKWLGLQSWVLHYRMLEECKTPESWQTLFIDNAIGFCKSDEYTLLDFGDLSEDNGFEQCNTASAGGMHQKKGKRRKKRRRNFVDKYSYDNELLDSGVKNDGIDLKLKTGSWLLSTDDFTVPWNAVDLPEHLSKHCLALWMKCLFAEWK